MDGHGLTELHRHIDGSMRRATLEALAAERGITVPKSLAFTPGMGLEAALACFALTLACLDTTDALARVTREICEDATEEGISYLELRFGPMLHAPLSPEDAVAAVVGRLGSDQWLILCGLYGDPPERFEQLVDLATANSRIVGIDIAGSPASMGARRLADYAPAFRRAKREGIGITVHCGEGRPAAEIEQVLDLLQPDRLGHATTLLASERATAMVHERDIALEACITSNVHAGAIERVEDHPLPLWHDRGLSAVLCADNTLFSETTVPEEIEAALRIPGVTREALGESLARGQGTGFAR